MSELNIDTDLGSEAAAELADAELQYLCGLSLWELAIRTGEAEFAAYLQNVLEMRRTREGDLEQVRTQRDLMHFAAQVMADIQQLPGTADRSSDPGTGLYL